MNKCDSEITARILTQQGLHITHVEAEADIIIINTCAVRDHAEQRALGRIGVLTDWKRQKPGRKLIVMGCMAKRLGDELVKMQPGIDFIIGPEHLRSLPDLLSADSPHPVAIVEDLHDETYSDLIPLRQKPLSGWVTVMRGCNNFCTYCIVPYTRGRERSRPKQDILQEIQQMADQGYLEVNLLGQNVNSYHDGSTDFPKLLAAVCQIDGIRRIRFMTSHPKDLSDRLIDVMAREPSLCKHIHLPMQAGSNAVLNAMNRKYTREDYLKLIEKTRAAMPGIAITTDIMVGFPGESEQNFEDTLDLVKTIRYDDAFMYYYSIRPGTQAAGMSNQISKSIKMKRLDRLIQCQRAIGKEIKLNMIGRQFDVLPESESKKDKNEWMGRTGTNHVIVFPKENIDPGEIVPVQVTECRGTTLRGMAANRR